MRIYTIGFTKKSANEFFNLIKKNDIQLLIDIRIHPQGQLAGFAKQEDLPYFLEELSNHCHYEHNPLLAPTKELLKKYRENKDWPLYEKAFMKLMDERQVPQILNKSVFENQRICLLCSEASPENCHRRLVAEKLASSWQNVEVIHI